MTSSQRIALNTLVNYTRTLFTAVLAIFASRWVLGALGVADYGLFGVVGSVIGFITFLNGVMQGSVTRHFAFAIGRGDEAEVNKWFNTALGIHIALPCLSILIGWPIGEYCIRHVFVIPADRVWVSLWIFRISLLAAFISMVSVPYVSMFSAKQRFLELAIWGIVQSLVSFAFSYSINFVTCNKLIYLALYGSGLWAVTQLGQMIQARACFRECRCRVHEWFDKERFKDMFSFAGWNLIGAVGIILRNQGSAILLNLNFGTRVNAAYGIANTVSSQTVTLSGAMATAFAPEVTASEGSGERERVRDLALRFCKFGSLLVLVFVIPLAVEMDYILKLWLKTPPEHTTQFCRLIMVTLLIERMTGGHVSAINATGRVALYQVTSGVLLLLSFPLSWLFLRCGGTPPSVGIAFVATQALCSLGCVYWAKRLVDMPARPWFMKVVVPCFVTATLSSVAALLLQRVLQPSFLRLLLTAATSTGVLAGAGWLMVLDDRERSFFKKNLLRVAQRIRGEAR